MKQVDFHRKSNLPLRFLAPRALASGIAIIIGLFVAIRNPFVGNFLAQEELEVGGTRGIESNE
jgi:hypothetical protein